MVTATSLFSSGGVGDLALRAAGATILVANELLDDRAAVYEANFPSTQMLRGDVRKLQSTIVKSTLSKVDWDGLDILFATPPCQGMSKNGMGKLLNEVRAGRRPALDQRNQLIISAVEIAKQLRPKLVVFENVPEMERTLIMHNDQLMPILEYVASELGPRGYVGDARVVQFADYGVPQRRQRLIAVYSRIPNISKLLRERSGWLASPTHSKMPSLLEARWQTVADVIGHLPPLDARSKSAATSSIAYHSVPVLDEEKYFWVSNTPPGASAFDNQCVNPLCRFAGNPTHGSQRTSDGINKARVDTPIHCARCGELLPRPWTRKDGKIQLMSGFTSAYKRMRPDLPASALTRNFSYACSDQKLHPSQNRVLSILEASIIQTLDRFDYKWLRSDGRKVSDKLIREIISESIPPLGLQLIFEHLIELVQQSPSRTQTKNVA
jgi:DNA (cytosine-5)-methyltransferase 1